MAIRLDVGLRSLEAQLANWGFSAWYGLEEHCIGVVATMSAEQCTCFNMSPWLCRSASVLDGRSGGDESRERSHIGGH